MNESILHVSFFGGRYKDKTWLRQTGLVRATKSLNLNSTSVFTKNRAPQSHVEHALWGSICPYIGLGHGTLAPLRIVSFSFVPWGNPPTPLARSCSPSLVPLAPAGGDESTVTV